MPLATKLKVIDLHCDLLTYLHLGEGRSPHDLICRCSLPQLKAGGVELQTLAIYTATGPNSVKSGQAQVSLYESLLQNREFTVAILPAFENGSGFATEEEPLKDGFARLNGWIKRIGPPLYISLTWDTENRFGGGNLTHIGLKADGKELLKFLSGRKIAIDFSHTSDPLAYDILDYRAKHSLDLPLLASHSNFRAITPVARNLPDSLALEIIRAGGLIGLNLFGPFFGPDLNRHIEHGLSLGGEDALCFGADFFCDADFPNMPQKYNTTHFFPYPDASHYPLILEQAPLTQLQKEQLAFRNVLLNQVAVFGDQAVEGIGEPREGGKEGEEAPGAPEESEDAADSATADP